MADGMLLLSWNSHHATFCDILSRLREKESFTDVTLACEGKCYPLHKLVLSACSEYLEKIIKSTPCKHPVIVLQDIRCSELEALINYMYVGEVNVPQSSLTFLIKAAELLQIKGLAVPDEPPSTNKKKASTHNVSDDQTSPQVKRKKYDSSSSSTCQQEHTQISSSPSPHRRERKDTSDYSKTQSANADQVVDQHHSSENSLGCIQDVFVETGIKEEVLEDINTDINLNAADSGLDYQTHNNSSYEVDDTRIENNTEGKGSFPLSVEYERQPLDQEMLSQAPIVSVSASEVQGWMTEGTLGGELTAVEGYSGVGVLDSSTMITQQGASSQEEQMVSADDQMLSEKTSGRNTTALGEAPTHPKHFKNITSGSSSQSAQRHIRKPFVCPICSKGFIHKSLLKIHLRSHTGEKPYSCPHCVYRSTRSGVLKNHIRTHTQEKPYPCPHCSYCSARLSTLKRHLYRHHQQ